MLDLLADLLLRAFPTKALHFNLLVEARLPQVARAARTRIRPRSSGLGADRNAPCAYALALWGCGRRRGR